MPASPVPTICYDLRAISRFFRSCALSTAIQQTTHLQWVTYRDSKVLNAVYTVLFWKEPPGTAEVTQGTSAEINRLTDQLHERYLLAWVRKLACEGPGSAQHYVAEMTSLRDYSRRATLEVYSDASQINAEVARETKAAIENLARIKLTAQVGVALIGGVAGIAFVSAAAAGAAGGAGMTILGLEAGAGGTAFAAAGTAHSVIHSVIKTWEGGGGAKVAAVSTDLGKSVASEGGGHWAGHGLEKALAGSERAEQIIRSAEGEIRKWSQKLAEGGLRKAAQRKGAGIVARQTANVQAQTAARQSFQKGAVTMARVGKVIPVVFAAWDILDAVGDYNDTMNSVH